MSFCPFGIEFFREKDIKRTLKGHQKDIVSFFLWIDFQLIRYSKGHKDKKDTMH